MQTAPLMPSVVAERGSSTSKPRILLVDDDILIRSSLTMVFEWHGYEVESVGEATAAMASLNRQLPDLIVTDLDLGPGVGGIGLIAEARRLHPQAPIIVVSGRDELRDEAIAAGALAFVPKPISVEELIEAVRENRTGITPS